MEIYFRENQPDRRFSLHDMGILACRRDGDDLVLGMDPGFVDMNDEVVAGCIRMEGVGFTDSYVHLMCYRDVLCGNVGEFCGKKRTLADFVANFSKEWDRMDVMGEFDGYRTVMLTGYVMRGTRIAEILMEIYYTGAFLYEVDE